MVTTQQLLITKPFWQANAMFMDHKLCVFPESYVMSLNSLNAKLLFDTSIDKSHLKTTTMKLYWLPKKSNTEF